MKLDIQLFAITVDTSFSESNISIPNNTSSLTVNIYFSPNNSSTWFQSKTLYCWVNGVEQSKNVGLSMVVVFLLRLLLITYPTIQMEQKQLVGNGILQQELVY